MPSDDTRLDNAIDDAAIAAITVAELEVRVRLASVGTKPNVGASLTMFVM